jgi:chromosomal replication initiation ATPase DnaA
MPRRPSRDFDGSRGAIARALAAQAPRPLCLVGRSGGGKTTLLRQALAEDGVEARWTTARDVVDEIVHAMRSGRYDRWREAFARDPRPVVIEHLEDLHGKRQTQQELGQLLDLRLSRGLAVVLTLTLEAKVVEMVEWLGACCDLYWTGPRADASPR